MVESEGRERMNAAGEMAAEGRYDQALQTIEAITPDFAHFDAVRKMHAQLELDRKAKELIDKGTSEQTAGRLTEAIVAYKQVDTKSKLLPVAQKKIAECQSALKAKAAAAAKKRPVTASSTGSTAKGTPVTNKEKQANSQILDEVTSSPK